MAREFMKPTISICIPTYNRSLNLSQLLDFLDEEFFFISDINRIELLISNNASEDNTAFILNNFQFKSKISCTILENHTNLGLIGNLEVLVSRSIGNYIWFMGDDDIYEKGIIKIVLNALIDNKFTYIFINHRSYQKYRGDGSGFESAINLDCNSSDDGKNLWLNIWNTTSTSLMFISSSIYKRDLIKDSLLQYKNTDLALPLFWSYYCCSKGPALLIKDILIDNVWGITSWHNRANDVFGFFIPRHLLHLSKYNYSLGTSFRVFSQYILRYKKCVIKTIIKKIIYVCCNKKIA